MVIRSNANSKLSKELMKLLSNRTGFWILFSYLLSFRSSRPEYVHHTTITGINALLSHEKPFLSLFFIGSSFVEFVFEALESGFKSHLI